MKRPKWTDGMLSARSNADALRQAAVALRLDAKCFKSGGMRQQAMTMRYAAQTLDRVANGKTWAEAFDWPPIDGGKKVN